MKEIMKNYLLSRLFILCLINLMRIQFPRVLASVFSINPVNLKQYFISINHMYNLYIIILQNIKSLLSLFQKRFAANTYFIIICILTIFQIQYNNKCYINLSKVFVGIDNNIQIKFLYIWQHNVQVLKKNHFFPIRSLKVPQIHSLASGACSKV